MKMSDLIQDDKKAGLLAAAIGGVLVAISALGGLSEIAKAQLQSAAYMLFSFVPIAFGRAAISAEKEDQEDADK